ncbi:MAG: NRDE family protein [Rudaea sp.]
MCLLLRALNTVPHRPWLLLGNRDEFHARPTAPAQRWSDAPHVIGGRDLAAGGSWMALNRNGRFAAVTNVRSGRPQAAAQSRGALVGAFVTGANSVADYLSSVARRREEFGPFNLIVGDEAGAGFVSSIDGEPRILAAGVHAFSNGSPQDDWPKMHRLRSRFQSVVMSAASDIPAVGDRAAAEAFDAALLDLLFDPAQPADDALPDTGVGIDLERRLAPVFVMPITVGDARYGTRASTLGYASTGGVHLLERRYDANAAACGETRLAA